MRRAVRFLTLVLIVMIAGPASAHATSGPVAAYGFEDTGAASAGDSSIFGNTGSVEGAVRVAGRHGAGLSFDGIDDVMRVADAGPLNLASGMTLEAWVKPAATTGWRTVMLKERRSNVSYGLYGSAAVIATDGVDGQAGISGLEAGVWTHLAATYDGTTLRVYADGAQVGASTARSGPITPGNGPLSIGGNSIWGEWFKGVIDEVRVYDRPLTAAQIQADMETRVGDPAGAPSGPGAAEIGSWSAPQAWPMVAVHASMLSTGKVVAWDAFSAAPQSEHVWDPVTGQFEPTPSGINLFCAGHALLPDGRLFVAGGHEIAYAGLRDTRLFSSTLRTWTAGPDMARGRWYPTTTTLPDGRVLIVSGDGIRPGPNDPFFVRPSDTIPEIYDPRTNTITAMPSAGRLMPLYPFMFVTPDGRVADVGPDTTTRLLDTATGQWATLASRSPITGGSAVMYRPGKVLKTGTWTDTDFGSPAIHNRSAVLDLDQTVPAWREVAPMKWARTYQTLTVLPDGDVLALGGQGTFGANSLVNSPVLQPEVWNPETDTWTPMAPSVRPRGYHNTSLLLPDGRILLAGSGRLDGSLMVNEMSAEVFSPPYLSKGPRPTITSAPATMQYGGTIQVQTPDAARIAKVSLVRMGAVTHNINMDQRWQQLGFRQVGGGLEIDAPTSANIAPPGVYYVFLLDDAGVPSKAAILSISGDTPDTTAPSVSVTAPAAGATVRGSVPVDATASDDAGVAEVQFELDGRPLGAADTTAPYSVIWDTTGASAGQHALTAVARDAAGNHARSASVTVTVGNSAPPGPQPVAAYAFEDGTGPTVTDATGRGHTGTIREAAWTTAGKHGKALTFDGVDDWVTIADTADLDLSSAMTLEAWVYPTRNTGWRTAILKENGSDLAWALYSSGSARPSAWASTSAGMGSVTGPAAPALNSWTHMAATYDGASLRLFVNGAQVASAPRGGPLTTSAGALRLGGNAIWNEWFAGRLDDVRIYDRALTPAQITADMSTPAGGAAPPPPVLSVSPASLSFAGTAGGADPAAKTLMVSGATTWSVSDDSAWLSVARAGDTITVTPSITGLAAGTYTADVTVSADTVRTIPVTLTVEPPPPAPALTPTTVLFTATQGGASPAAKAVSVTNTGSGTLQLTAGSSASWLAVTPTSATAPATLTLTPTTGALAAGTHTATVTVTPDGGAPKSVNVTLIVNPAMPPGLVGAWGFDEATGTAAIDGSGGQTGTITGATRTAAGRFGGALSFDGVDDWVTVPDGNPLDLTTGMTVEAWIRPSAVGTDWRTVLLKEQPGNLVYALYAGDGAGRAATHVFTTADRGANASTATPLNAWTHVAATYDRTSLRLYVNGVQAGTRALTGSLRTSTGALRIGGNNVWGEWFAGLIDEVRVYGRALTATEIQADMAAPVSGG